jgi:hypothetical protein
MVRQYNIESVDRSIGGGWMFFDGRAAAPPSRCRFDSRAKKCVRAAAHDLQSVKTVSNKLKL